MTGSVSLAAARVAVALVLCLVMQISAQDSLRTRDSLFSNSWTASRRARLFPAPAPAQAPRRVRCDRQCQLERSKALPACEQPPRDLGMRCGDELVRYSYVAASNSCVPFLYGGCRGNANNFPTFEMCRDRCKMAPAPSRVIDLSRTSHTETARHSADRRELRQPFRPRVPSGGSKIFFSNRFGGGRTQQSVGTQSEGIGPRRGGGSPSFGVGPRRGGIFFSGPTAAPVRQTLSRKTRAACFSRPRLPGWTCREAEVRYSYIASSNSCVPFEFGGCGGSSNRFDTFFECSNLCKTVPQQSIGIGPRRGPMRNPACRQPWEAGSCRGYGPMMRYFYNDRTAKCEMALYSGCGGNANRFFSRHSCERTCLLRRG